MTDKKIKIQKELLFLEPIKHEMTVDEIYNRLINIFKEKGIKIYPDIHYDKGAEQWIKLTQKLFM